jgi:hypothetical protein
MCLARINIPPISPGLHSIVPVAYVAVVEANAEPHACCAYTIEDLLSLAR